MFRITVQEIMPNNSDIEPHNITRYEQTVDAIDLHKLATLLNPPPKRVYKRQAAKAGG